MITRRELRRLAARQRVSLGALEKDYVLSTVLRRLYVEQWARGTLVLKGGTALHKLYLHRRLSLDLDFTALRPVTLDEVRPYLEVPELQTQVKAYQVFRDALTIERLGFVGPLEHPNSIKVDISFRESLALPPVTRRMETPYYEPFTVTAMQLEEMVAEKLRAALMRKAPRDYLDLWLVLKAGTLDRTLIPELLAAKLEMVGLTYEAGLLWRDLDRLGELWQADLGELMPQMPDAATILRDLRAGLPSLLPE